MKTCMNAWTANSQLVTNHVRRTYIMTSFPIGQLFCDEGTCRLSVVNGTQRRDPTQVDASIHRTKRPGNPYRLAGTKCRKEDNNRNTKENNTKTKPTIKYQTKKTTSRRRWLLLIQSGSAQLHGRNQLGTVGRGVSTIV